MRPDETVLATPIERIRSLDGIRGLAAMSVVLFHLLQSGLNATQVSGDLWITVITHWPLRLLWGGFEGVICFFVLSGFVLTLPFLRARPPFWRAFAARRILRLFPPYLAAILLSAGLLFAFVHERTDTMTFILAGRWKYDVTIPSLISGSLMLHDQIDVNGALWSLVHEMRISLVFPLIFLATRYLGVAGESHLRIPVR